MSITFYVLKPSHQAEQIALIERIKNDFDCLCFGVEAHEWATSALSYNINPQHDGKPFSATTFAIELFTDGHFWRVPHDSAVFLGGEETLDAYACAAILLKKHGQLTFEDLGVYPDGDFIHRVALVDKFDKGGWAQEEQTEMPSEYLTKLHAMQSYVREPAADSAGVKQKVVNVLKWLIDGSMPVGT